MPLNPLEITGGLAIGEGVGGAIADTVEPRLQSFKNDQWSKHKDKPLEAGTAAEVAAEDVDLYATMETQASYSGYDADRFADLYRVTLTAPGVGTLIELLRRNGEEPIDFERGLRKAKLGNQWDKALRNLRDLRIPGPDLAYMVVRGVVPDGGTLPSALPTSADRLQLPPQLAINTIAEAAKTGWDAERFAALVARSGLAMAPIMAAQANFRGILTDNDYELTIARGDLFPAYADPVREVARQILTSGEYVERQIRGFTDRAGRLLDTDKHGMSHADSDKLYEVLGRSPSIHTLVVGLARGGKYPGSYTNVPEPFRADIQRSNIREEFSEVAYAARYNYPSAFVLRALAEAGQLGNTAAVNQILLEIGWPPHLAETVSSHWVPKGASADPHVTKAQTHLWTTTHASYKAGEIDDAAVTAALPHAGVDTASIPGVLAVWQVERGLVRATLSAADIRKALQHLVVNEATGVAWTKPEAVTALVARGWDAADASQYLDIS